MWDVRGVYRVSERQFNSSVGPTVGSPLRVKPQRAKALMTLLRTPAILDYRLIRGLSGKDNLGLKIGDERYLTFTGARTRSAEEVLMAFERSNTVVLTDVKRPHLHKSKSLQGKPV